MSVKFDLKYYKGNGEYSHSYSEEWEETDLYCPSCGHVDVWVEKGEGDYYEGQSHLCMNCHATFTMPSLRAVDVSDKTAAQRCHEIQRYKADKP